MRTGKPNLISLALHTGEDFQENLSTLIAACDSCPVNSIIVAPEVTVTGFCYDRFEEAAAFAKTVDTAMILCSKNNKTIIITLIEKENNHFYNSAKLYHQGEIVYQQKKHKLFPLGNEDLHFNAGESQDIRIWEVNGIKVGILICFELRFIDLWQQLKGADIIIVPAQWGKARSDHFLTLTKALAIANQCYVIASDATNIEMSAGSGIITPFGVEYRNGTKLMQTLPYDKEALKKMRRYINVGISNG